MSGTISTSGISIPILVFFSEQGFLSDRPIKQAEELTSPGADGARWRIVSLQFPSFVFTTVIAANTVNAAIAYKRDIEGKMIHAKVTLNVTIDGVGYSMKKLHVEAAQAAIFPGPLYGVGAGSAQAHVVATWRVKGTDFAGAEQ